MNASGARTLLESRAFLEGPRWRDGRLFVSDMHRNVVEAVDLEGNVEVVCEVPNNPSGLGWLPDGRLLVASMLDRTVMRLEPDGTLVAHADLSELASGYINDMVVDDIGRAYVGNFGFDLHNGAEFAAAELVIVEPDGSARLGAGDMAFPNGTVITPDGSTLIVGQSFGRDLVAFDIEANGDLSNRRQWADLGKGTPDGICLDAEGAVWYADPVKGGCVRVAEGGEVLERVETPALAYACMLGGLERRDLFMCVSTTSSPHETLDAMSASVVVVEVDTPGAGIP